MATRSDDGTFIRSLFRHTSGNFRVLVDTALEQLNHPRPIVFSECAISSVVPELLEPISQLLSNRLSLIPFILKPGAYIGISLHYNQKEDLGADRIANAISAHYFYKTPAIIVDFGTATTISVIDSDSTLLGGMILMGIHTFVSGLNKITSLLPDVSIEPVASAIGHSTKECIHSGFHYGYPGLIDSCLRAISNELTTDALVIGTGGASKFIDSLMPSIDVWDPDLTLKGIYKAWELNHTGSMCTCTW